ncbi:MAG: diguanylate cyclase domain-containing protein [Alphaproteobacteria bacterium]
MPDKPAAENRPLRLLIVDDDAGEHEQVCQNLGNSKGPFEIDSALGFVRGIERIASENHDCVLIANRLNGRGGLDLMREAIDRHLTTAPFIILGQSGDAEGEHDALAAGAADWLEKDELPAALLQRSVRYVVESYQSREKLANLELIDPLTGLPTSVLFWHLAGQSFERAKRNKETLAGVALYLNGLSTINETHGWDGGDAALRTQALRLRGALRANDCVARLGGARFMILLENIPDPADVNIVTEKIIEIVSPPFEYQGAAVALSPAIGVSFFPLNAQSAQGLIRDATIAMDRAIDDGASLRMA